MQLIFYEFEICYGAANKVVKQNLEIGKDLDNICLAEVQGKNANTEM